MITELSQEQETLLKSYHSQWLSIGTNTDPADRPRAEKAIAGLYRIGNKQMPHVIWTKSPLAAIKLLTHISVFNQTGILQDLAPETIYDFLHMKVNDASFTQSQGQVTYTIGQLNALEEEFKRTKTDNLQYFRNYGGQLEAGWVAFYKYCQELGVEYDETSAEGLELWAEQAKSCGIWFAFDQICVISERPSFIQVEPVRNSSTYQLHNSTGPALEYADGFKLYYFHGVKVTQQIIERPLTLTAEQVLNEPNAEVRRVMIEKMGYERFFSITNAEVLDEDVEPTGNPRRLLSIHLPSDPDGHIVVTEVQCTTTGKKYYLRVPPNMKTCLQAIAWTANMSPEDYVVLAES